MTHLLYFITSLIFQTGKLFMVSNLNLWAKLPMRRQVDHLHKLYIQQNIVSKSLRSIILTLACS